VFKSISGENQIFQIIWQCIPDTRPGDWKNRLNSSALEQPTGCYSTTGDDTWIVFERPEHTAHSGTLEPICSDCNRLSLQYKTGYVLRCPTKVRK